MRSNSAVSLFRNAGNRIRKFSMISLQGSADTLRCTSTYRNEDEVVVNKSLTSSPMSNGSVDNCLFSVTWDTWEEEIGLQLYNKERIYTQGDIQGIRTIDDFIATE